MKNKILDLILLILRKKVKTDKTDNDFIYTNSYGKMIFKHRPGGRFLDFEELYYFPKIACRLYCKKVCKTFKNNAFIKVTEQNKEKMLFKLDNI